MTRVRRRPGKIDLYFEWIECIFWLIPLGIVILGAALGAVAIYLSSSLFATGCARVAGTRSYKRRRFDWERTKPIRAGMAWEAASFETEAAKIGTRFIQHHPGYPVCNSSTLLGRAGKGRRFRMGLSGGNPKHKCKRASSLGSSRFRGAPTNDRSRSDGF